MIITVNAKPKKKKEYIEQLTPSFYVVAVKEPAIEGRANEAIIKSLAKYFGISQTEIEFVSGEQSKLKKFCVPDHLADFEVLPKQKKLF